MIPLVVATVLVAVATLILVLAAVMEEPGPVVLSGLLMLASVLCLAVAIEDAQDREKALGACQTPAERPIAP